MFGDAFSGCPETRVVDEEAILAPFLQIEAAEPA